MEYNLCDERDITSSYTFLNSYEHVQYHNHLTLMNLYYLKSLRFPLISFNISYSMQHRELPHNPTITLDICSIQRLYPDSTIFDLRSISVDSVCQINKTNTISELRTYEFFESSLLPIQSPFIDPIYPFALDSHQRYQAFLLTPFDLFQWCGYDSNTELFEVYMLQMTKDAGYPDYDVEDDDSTEDTADFTVDSVVISRVRPIAV